MKDMIKIGIVPGQNERIKSRYAQPYIVRAHLKSARKALREAVIYAKSSIGLPFANEKAALFDRSRDSFIQALKQIRKTELATAKYVIENATLATKALELIYFCLSFDFQIHLDDLTRYIEPMIKLRIFIEDSLKQRDY